MEQREVSEVSNAPPKETPKSNNIDLQKVNEKIDLTYVTTEILRLLITEHFWGSVIVISIAGIGYLIYHYGINIQSFFNISDIVLTGGTSSIYHILILILICIVLCVVLFNSNKIMYLMHHNEFNQSINKMIVEECNQIKTEITSLIRILTSLQLMHEDLHKSLKSLIELVDTESINTKKIRQELYSINNVIHKIPNRDAIINMLVIRTRLIYNDISEAILDYISIINMAKGTGEIIIGSNINKSKMAFVEDRLNHTMDEIRTLYISDVYLYSKNTLNPDVKSLLQEALNETFAKIRNEISKYETSLTVEELFYTIREDIKELTVSVSGIFDKGLMLTSFFDNDSE